MGEIVDTAPNFAFTLYDTFGMRWISSRTHIEMQAWQFDQRDSTEPMQEQKSRARASWKGAASRPRILPISSYRDPSSRAIGRLVLHGCEVLAIIRTGKGCRSSKLASPAKLFLITRRSTPSLAGRLVIRDGFIQTIHNTVVAEVTGSIRRFRGCGRIRLSQNRRCTWATSRCCGEC